MREHIAYHIVVGDLINNVNTCGYCGGNDCNIELKKTSGEFSKPFSNCKYHVNFSLKPAERSTRSKPCTNRPIKCELCDVTMWSYNIEPHYLVSHPDMDITNEKFKITDKEKNALKALVTI